MVTHKSKLPSENSTPNNRKSKLKARITSDTKSLPRRLRWFIPFYKNRKRWSSKFVWWAGLAVVLIAIFSYLTNPFVRFSVVNTQTSEIVLEGDQLILKNVNAPILQDRAFFSQLAYIKSGWHIFAGKISGGRKASRASVDQIIAEIHRLRFDPSLPFIISGDHFSVFYNRSLGIFYHSLMDRRTALNYTDWLNRQLIYSKSLLYALEVYAQSNRLSTTIVPIGPRSVALLDIYAYPSDTLYSLLYGLDNLISDSSHQIYRFDHNNASELPLKTTALGQEILNNHSDSLRRHFDLYIEKVVDPQTGLIRKDIELSSTKDMVFRQSSFYDNVIMWRTYQLADQLGIIDLDDDFIVNLKQRILDTFWLDNAGYFLDHLSPEAVENSYYSSDWLIAYQTGFLKPSQAEDLAYLLPTVEYIRRNALDRPFGVAYQAERRPHETHLLPQTFAPDYGATAIWSNWGMEYTKLLIGLAQETKDVSYLNEAENQLFAYAYNIRRYRGYPELYNHEGDFFRQTVYKSIRQTGWVVTFEQAREMHEWTKLNWSEI